MGCEMKKAKRKIKEIDLVDYIERFHIDNIYIPTRTVYFGSSQAGVETTGEVNSYTVGQTIKNLHILDELNHKPITLLLNTPGGSWEDGMAVYDVIKSLKSEVTIVGMGKIYSMGSIIMQAGDKRLLMSNSYVMIHDGTESYDGNSKAFEAWAGFAKQTRMRMYEIYHDKMQKKDPRINIDQIEKMCAHDKIFNAEEAIEIGLADRVIGENNE